MIVNAKLNGETIQVELDNNTVMNVYFSVQRDFNTDDFETQLNEHCTDAGPDKQEMYKWFLDHSEREIYIDMYEEKLDRYGDRELAFDDVVEQMVEDFSSCDPTAND